MTNLDIDDLSYIVSNLISYMAKEIDTPMSSRTHLYMALYRILENLSEADVEDLPLDGIAHDVVMEHFYVFKNVPTTLSKFTKHT